ncbi:MAG TPA: hypothetical protein VGJ36_07590 [Gemmatimonadales bacterium]|jgi:hypothetical protein
MRSLLWLPLTALLVFGCKDTPTKVTAPAEVAPNDGDAVDLDRIAENMAAQAGVSPRCLQVRYKVTGGTLRKVQRGSDCSCVSGRQASVTAAIWGGSTLNQVIGKAYCVRVAPNDLIATARVQNLSSGISVASMVGTQSEGIASCILNAGGVLTNRSANLVICMWH